MDYDKIGNLNSPVEHYPLVQKHIKEANLVIEEKKELDYLHLKYLQLHESMLYKFYKLLYESRLLKTGFHGYQLLTKINLESPSSFIEGDVYILQKDVIFNNLISYNSFKISEWPSMNYFDENILNSPTPFLILPKCNLQQTNDFLKGCKNLAIQHESFKIIILDPFEISKIGLDFFIKDVISDRNIHSLFIGFIWEIKTV